MKSLRLKFVVFLMSCVGIAYSQDALNTSGGEASGIRGKVSYSVGQLFYSTMFGSNGNIVQGVQQPYEISVVSGMEQTKSFKLECMAYPNPTEDILTLKVEDVSLTSLYYQLYHINGKLIETRNIKDLETKINMSSLAHSTYLLRIIDNQKLIITFKIIKK